MSTGEPDDIFDGDPFDPDVIAAAEMARYDETQTQDDAVKAYIRKRATMYRQVFTRDDAATLFVMMDLARFCRSYESRYHPDRTKQDMLEGRAEVFYRIMDHTRLDHDTLFLKYTDARAKMEIK